MRGPTKWDRLVAARLDPSRAAWQRVGALGPGVVVTLRQGPLAALWHFSQRGKVLYAKRREGEEGSPG
jgi:hypothetical protein